MINSAKLKTNKNLRERKIPSSGRKAPITKKMTAKYRLAAEDTTSSGMASGSREKKYGKIRFALDNSIIKVVSKEHSRFAIFLSVFLLVFIGDVILLRNVFAIVYLGILMSYSFLIKVNIYLSPASMVILRRIKGWSSFITNLVCDLR